MKLLKLLLVIVLILNLVACLALPIDKKQFYNEGNTTEQNQEIHEEQEIEETAEDKQDKQAQEDDIDEESK